MLKLRFWFIMSNKLPRELNVDSAVVPSIMDGPRAYKRKMVHFPFTSLLCEAGPVFSLKLSAEVKHFSKDASSPQDSSEEFLSFCNQNRTVIIFIVCLDSYCPNPFLEQ